VEVVGNGGMSILCSERLAPIVTPRDSVGLRLRSSTQGIVWETLDFLAASATLAVRMQVRDELDGKPLTDGMKPTMSDHLPVAGTLDLP
jgi:hypothetical protein